MDQGPHPQPRQARVSDLVERLDTAHLVGDGTTVVTGVQYDSRLVRPGHLFAALPGADFDGHAYVDRAIANGASALLVERTMDVDVTQVVVPDSRAALAPVSARFYEDPSNELTVIGITGTDGKTTTSAIVEHILAYAGQVPGMVGTVGIRVGQGVSYSLPHQTTPESNLLQGYLREMVERGVTHAVIEATSHGLSMHRLDGTAIAIAGVTNMTHEHLEYHKTVENYWRAKAILVERVADAGGVVVVNIDDEGARSALAYTGDATVLTTSSMGNAASISAQDLEVNVDGTRFVVRYNYDSASVEMPLIGAFNVDNALIAIGIAIGAGIDLTTCAEALRTAPGVPGRMQVVVEGQEFPVIVDYAHTPESLRKILTLLRSIHQGRIIVVTGSAGERDASKRPLQGAVCAQLADVTILANEDPRNEDPVRIIEEIASGAREAGAVDGATLLCIPDRRTAIKAAFDLADPDTLVLLAGKGHEQSIIVGYEHTPWDEVSVARELLRELAGRDNAS